MRFDKLTAILLICCAVTSLYLNAAMLGLINGTFSFNLSRAAALCFSGMQGTLFWFIMTLVLFMFALYIRAYGFTPIDDMLDERNFRYSESGIYGTAAFLAPDEVKGAAIISTPLQADGAILGQLTPDATRVISQDEHSWNNRHVAVCGGSGSRKSRAYVRNAIIQSAKPNKDGMQASILVTDPKGELYQDTATYLRERGYIVRSLNLRNPLKSDSWNCLNELRGNPDRAQLFSHIVVESTSPDKDIWRDAKKSLLSAIILRVTQGADFPPEQKTMRTVYRLLASGEGELALMFDDAVLHDVGATSAALSWQFFEGNSPNGRAAVISSLGNALAVFQSEEVCLMTDRDDLDLSLPAKQPCAYFCILPDQESSKDYFASLFFSFLFADLVDYVDRVGAKNTLPVNFLLDEFPNIGQIPDFDKKVATVRSRKLNLSIIFQSVSQFRAKYRDTWVSIIGNCDTLLFLGCGTDQENARFFSERTGDTTVKVRTDQHEKIETPAQVGRRHSTGEGRRRIMDENEVLRLDSEKCLIIFKGKNVMEAYKFDYTQHPESKKLKPMMIDDLPDLTNTAARQAMYEDEKAMIAAYQHKLQTGEAFACYDDGTVPETLRPNNNRITPLTPFVSVSKDAARRIRKAFQRHKWSVCDGDEPASYGGVLERPGARTICLTEDTPKRNISIQDGLVIDNDTGELIGRMVGTRIVPCTDVDFVEIVDAEEVLDAEVPEPIEATPEVEARSEQADASAAVGDVPAEVAEDAPVGSSNAPEETAAETTSPEKAVEAPIAPEKSSAVSIAPDEEAAETKSPTDTVAGLPDASKPDHEEAPKPTKEKQSVPSPTTPQEKKPQEQRKVRGDLLTGALSKHTAESLSSMMQEAAQSAKPERKPSPLRRKTITLEDGMRDKR